MLSGSSSVGLPRAGTRLCQSGYNLQKEDYLEIKRLCDLLPRRENDLFPSGALHLCSQSRYNQEDQRLGGYELVWPNLRCQETSFSLGKSSPSLCWLLPHHPSCFPWGGGSGFSPGEASLCDVLLPPAVSASCLHVLLLARCLGRQNLIFTLSLLCWTELCPPPWSVFIIIITIIIVMILRAEE